MNRPIIAVVVLAIAAAVGGGWYFWRSGNPAPQPPASVSQSPPPAAPPQDTGPVHPLPDTGTGTGEAALPALNDSDPVIRQALAGVAGQAAVTDYLVSENVIRRIVVTVDNLARSKAPLEQRPVAAAPGTFRAAGDELHATLDPRNFARYQPLVSIIQNLDIARLTALYVHFYPLLQLSYQNLGYPNAYFNDRLVEVIDILLATPAPSGPVELVRPSVMYEFADPSLEGRPAGQKLLIRMGPDNSRIIKAKLMELRAAVTAAPIKHP
jgi:hypothetical protein